MTSSEFTTDLEALGFDAHFSSAFAQLSGDFQPARVAAAHGQSYVLWTARGLRTGILVGRRLAEWSASPERPQVGDWVAAEATASDAWAIEHVLSRRTCLVRMAAGLRAVPQVLAANVDVVGVVSAFAKGGPAKQRRVINEARLRRYLAAISQSGAQPLFIMNKTDLSETSALVAATLSEQFPGVPLVLTCAISRGGLDGLTAWLRPATTLGLIGMSGVGKSTLVNALLNRDAQRTGDIREADARGRHTTTHRELFQLESGALLMDMPGTREFAVWGEDEKVEHPRGWQHSRQRTR